MSPYEVVMLLCFGASWPFALHKTWKTKNVSGKSVVFLSLIVIGYAAGVVHKLMHLPDPVVWLYVLNGIMVSAELCLWFRYHRNTPGLSPRPRAERVSLR